MINNNIKFLFNGLQKPNNFLLIYEEFNSLHIFLFKIIRIFFHTFPHFLIVLVLCGQYLEVVISLFIIIYINVLLLHQGPVYIIKIMSQCFLFYDFVKIRRMPNKYEKQIPQNTAADDGTRL